MLLLRFVGGRIMLLRGSLPGFAASSAGAGSTTATVLVVVGAAVNLGLGASALAAVAAIVAAAIGLVVRAGSVGCALGRLGV